MSTELLAVAHLNTDEADECLVGMLHEELLVHLKHLAATAHLYKYSPTYMSNTFKAITIAMVENRIRGLMMMRNLTKLAEGPRSSGCRHERRPCKQDKIYMYIRFVQAAVGNVNMENSAFKFLKLKHKLRDDGRLDTECSILKL